jgi:glucose dehydrogenase
MRFQSLFLASLPLFSPFVSAAAAAANVIYSPTYPQNVGNWTGWGGNSYNNRWAITNQDFNSKTIKNIVQHCQIQFQGGISATPTISGDFAYFPTWGGQFAAVNYKTCDIAWQINVKEIITGFAEILPLQTYSQAAVSRTSPQVDGDVLYFGTLVHALLVAVDITDGTLLGTFQVHDHVVAQITQSPTLYEGVIYVGAASEEEMAVTSNAPVWPCCSFVGSFGAYTFDKTTKNFTQKWVTSTIGDSSKTGFLGAGVWGSQPPVDSVRNQVFFNSGNLYTYPDSYRTCTTTACMPTDVYHDSMFAVDMETGKINWVRTMNPLDAWTFACVPPYDTTEGATRCPWGPGPDADFGMAGTFVPASLGPNTIGVDSVLAGQKSGYIHSVSAADGTYQWGTLTGPGDGKGGLAWGIAVDDTMAYYSAINYANLTWTLPDGTEITNGAFGALDHKTGTVVWAVAIPNLELSEVAPTVIGDIIMTGSTGSNAGYTPGNLIALNKNTGEMLVNLQLDSTYHGGIAFANNFMLVPTGYSYQNVSPPSPRKTFGLLLTSLFTAYTIWKSLGLYPASIKSIKPKTLKPEKP